MSDQEINRLPASVIEEDHRLERTADRASTALMELRWRWTLDESNPERVSFAAYARDVARHPDSIRTSARGYEIRREQGEFSLTPAEAVERARVGAEKESVIAAIADARGQTFSTIAVGRRDEVKRVRQLAREASESKGTTVEEEARKLAQSIVRAETARQETTDARRERHGLRYIELDGYLASALRYLARAAKLAGELSWDEEEQMLLTGAVEQIRQLCTRVDQRIAGVSKVDLDWETEIEAILAKGGS